MAPEARPYGEWASPIDSALITSASVRLGAPLLDAATGDAYWVEGRPAEGGRCVLCRAGADGDAEAVSPPGVSVRSRVHEYGGGEALVHDGVVYFSAFADGRLYRLSTREGDGGGAAQALSPPPDADSGAHWRFADVAVDARRGRLLAVGERHACAQDAAPENCLVALPLRGGGSVTVVASGADFYASPRLSADGGRLAWVQWRHPHLPWDATQLCVADVAADGALGAPRCVAGAPGAPEEACMQPRWSPSGRLLFLSDRSGFWNLYAHSGGDAAEAPRALCPMEAECGAPAWLLGGSAFASLPDRRIVCASTAPDAAKATLALLPGDVDGDAALTVLECPFSECAGITAAPLPGGGARIALLGGAPDAPTAVACLDVPPGCDVAAAAAAPGAWRRLRAAADVALDARYISLPRALSFPAATGLREAAPPGGDVSWLYYYAPTNPDFAPPPGGPPPPLLVKCHGGPTAAASPAFNLVIQYWTSRGWAVADVNYGGSSGFGRAYRRRLAGRWGEVDVGDACGAAAALAAAGLADASRCAIDGGSAGGFTALAALAFRPGVFAAGASMYGIGDLVALAAHTHKFESRYLDALIGPLPAAAALYAARSPLHAAARIAAPLALFQGEEDAVVPPAQARAMFEALQQNRLPAALVMLPGEGHGFRAARSIRRALDGERQFLSAVFRIALTDAPPDVEPLEIVNWP